MNFKELKKYVPEKMLDQWLSQPLITFHKGEFIISPGEKMVYVIMEGTTQVLQIHPDGKECIIALVQQGECLGITELFSKREQKRFVRALTRVKVIALPIEQLEVTILQTPKLAQHLFTYLSERLEETFAILEQVAYGKVEERLLFTLKKLTANDENVTKAYRPIPAYLTHRDLAGMIGSTRETVTFIINKLLHQGVIIQKGEMYLIKND